MIERIQAQALIASTQIATTHHWLKHEINTSTSTAPTSTPPTAPPIPAMAIARNCPIRWCCTSLAWEALQSVFICVHRFDKRCLIEQVVKCRALTDLSLLRGFMLLAETRNKIHRS